MFCAGYVTSGTFDGCNAIPATLLVQTVTSTTGVPDPSAIAFLAFGHFSDANVPEAAS